MKIIVVENLANKKIRKGFKKLSSPELRLHVMRAAASALQEASEFAFEKQADPETGEKWKKWSKDWRRWREEHGYTPGKILELSGQLASSLTTEYNENFAVLGTNKIYANIHQWGGLATMPPGPAAIPARPFMGLDEEGEALIYDAIEKALDDVMSDK